MEIARRPNSWVGHARNAAAGIAAVNTAVRGYQQTRNLWQAAQDSGWFDTPSQVRQHSDHNWRKRPRDTQPTSTRASKRPKMVKSRYRRSARYRPRRRFIRKFRNKRRGRGRYGRKKKSSVLRAARVAKFRPRLGPASSCNPNPPKMNANMCTTFVTPRIFTTITQGATTPLKHIGMRFKTAWVPNATDNQWPKPGDPTGGATLKVPQAVNWNEMACRYKSFLINSTRFKFTVQNYNIFPIVFFATLLPPNELSDTAFDSNNLQDWDDIKDHPFLIQKVIPGALHQASYFNTVSESREDLPSGTKSTQKTIRFGLKLGDYQKRYQQEYEIADYMGTVDSDGTILTQATQSPQLYFGWRPLNTGVGLTTYNGPVIRACIMQNVTFSNVREVMEGQTVKSYPIQA